MPSLILSIYPKYAKMIYESKKVVEFRKTKPKINIIDINSTKSVNKSNLTWCFLYETSPVQSVTGVMLLENILDISNYNYDESLYFLGNKTRKLFNGGCPEKIKFPGITEIEFNNYYKNSNKKYAWVITYARNFRCKKLSLKDLDKQINSPPQSWCYLHKNFYERQIEALSLNEDNWNDTDYWETLFKENIQ